MNFDRSQHLTNLAKVLGRERKTFYNPTGNILNDIGYLYRLNGDCLALLKKGCLEEFERHFLALHEDFADAPAEGEKLGSELARAPADVLMEDPWADLVRKQTDLASLLLRTGQSAPVPGEIALGFDLNCPEFRRDDFATGVKRGVLTFLCGMGKTTETKARTGYPSGVEYNGVRFTLLSVDDREPSWRVETSGEKAIGLARRRPAGLHSRHEFSRQAPW